MKVEPEITAEEKTGIERRMDERIQLDRPVSLQFPDFRDFISAITDNISANGMFIRTPAVRAVGAQFQFKLTLPDGFTLIEGTGEVVWLHIQQKGYGSPTGMGVRFLNLEGESQELVNRIVAEHGKDRRAPLKPAVRAPRRSDRRHAAQH